MVGLKYCSRDLCGGCETVESGGFLVECVVAAIFFWMGCYWLSICFGGPSFWVAICAHNDFYTDWSAFWGCEARAAKFLAVRGESARQSFST